MAILIRLVRPKAFVDFCGKKHSAAGADTARAVMRNFVPVEIGIFEEIDTANSYGGSKLDR